MVHPQPLGHIMEGLVLPADEGGGGGGKLRDVGDEGGRVVAFGARVDREV